MIGDFELFGVGFGAGDDFGVGDLAGSQGDILKVDPLKWAGAEFDGRDISQDDVGKQNVGLHQMGSGFRQAGPPLAHDVPLAGMSDDLDLVFGLVSGWNGDQGPTYDSLGRIGRGENAS